MVAHAEICLSIGLGAIVVLDSLNAVATSAPQFLAAFLSTIITPSASVVAIWHTDVPVVVPREKGLSEYEPDHLTVLSYLATAVLRVSSLEQEVERKRARDRSVQEPGWGLGEGRDGVLVGLRRSGRGEDHGVVLEMEVRKRSGRAVAEKFVLSSAGSSSASPPEAEHGAPAVGRISLLADHPAFRPESHGNGPGTGVGDGGEAGPESTFNLELTEKQRRDRDGIVLPYFDAQTDIGAGEGGRILYEMGREDDFDDEEDEI